MARQARVAPGGLVYHVLNRSAGKFKFLARDKDRQALEQVLIETQQRHPIAIYAYCFMETHWHFVVEPKEDGDLTAFFRWFAHTHAMRWRVAHSTVGWGHLYQGRFKSFAVEHDKHFLDVCRYVERNALTGGMVTRAEEWQWSSLWARDNASDALRGVLAPWPVDRPQDWVAHVNEPIGGKEIEHLQRCMARGTPYGSPAFEKQAIRRLQLQHTTRERGRPPKKG